LQLCYVVSHSNLDGATCGDSNCPLTHQFTAIMLLLEFLGKRTSFGLVTADNSEAACRFRAEPSADRA